MSRVAESIIPSINIQGVSVQPISSEPSPGNPNSRDIQFSIKVRLSTSDQSPANTTGLSWFNVRDYMKYFKIYCAAVYHDSGDLYEELDKEVLSYIMNPLIRQYEMTGNPGAYLARDPETGLAVWEEDPSAESDNLLLHHLSGIRRALYGRMLALSDNPELNFDELYRGYTIPPVPGRNSRHISLMYNRFFSRPPAARANDVVAPEDMLRTLKNKFIVKMKEISLESSKSDISNSFAKRKLESDQRYKIEYGVDFQLDTKAYLPEGMPPTLESHGLQNLKIFAWIDFDIFEAFKEAGIPFTALGDSGVLRSSIMQNLAGLPEMVDVIKDSRAIQTTKVFLERSGRIYTGQRSQRTLQDLSSRFGNIPIVYTERDLSAIFESDPTRPYLRAFARLEPYLDGDNVWRAPLLTEQERGLINRSRVGILGNQFGLVDRELAQLPDRVLEVSEVRNFKVRFVNPMMVPTSHPELIAPHMHRSGPTPMQEIADRLRNLNSRIDYVRASTFGPSSMAMLKQSQNSTRDTLIRDMLRSDPKISEISSGHLPYHIIHQSDGDTRKIDWPGAMLMMNVSLERLLLNNSNFYSLYQSMSNARRKEILDTLRNDLHLGAKVYRRQIQTIHLSKNIKDLPSIRFISGTEKCIKLSYDAGPGFGPTRIPDFSSPRGAFHFASEKSISYLTSQILPMGTTSRFNNTYVQGAGSPEAFLQLVDFDTTMASTVGCYMYSLELDLVDPIYKLLINQIINLKDALSIIERYLAVAYIPSFGNLDDAHNLALVGIGLHNEGSVPAQDSGALTSTGYFTSDFLSSNLTSHFNRQLVPIIDNYHEAHLILRGIGSTGAVSLAEENWQEDEAMRDQVATEKDELQSVFTVGPNIRPEHIEYFKNQIKELLSCYRKIVAVSDETLEEIAASRDPLQGDRYPISSLKISHDMVDSIISVEQDEVVFYNRGTDWWNDHREGSPLVRKSYPRNAGERRFADLVSEHGGVIHDD